MRRRSAGFTLAEAVIVLSLVAVLLTVMGQLFWRFTSAMRRSGEKETALQGAIDTFDRVGADFASAINITLPTTSWSQTVQLDRLYPHDTTRFPTPPAGPTATWATHPAPVTMSVTYTYSAADWQLQRSATFNGVTTNTTAAEGICYFQCQLIQIDGISRFARMQVSIMRDGAPHSVIKAVALHLPPAVVP